MRSRRDVITGGGAMAATAMALGVTGAGGSAAAGAAENANAMPQVRSIAAFGVEPGKSPAANRRALQEAIDWAHPRGAALIVEPGEEPYRVDGGLILRRNVSLLGVHGPVGRGTRHPGRPQPVGSVFAIEDEQRPFLTVEGATQVRGIQFWYPQQTLNDPDAVIEYPATIKVSEDSSAQGVTLTNLTFFGEFTATDCRATQQTICEQVLMQHCYGYPLSGRFIAVDYCYDIPRILNCHVNPANRRFIDGGYSREVIDSVLARKTFAFSIDHTDNAQVIDAFTFGTYGGAYLGAASYGQMTNFNYDCVTIGIHKLGDNDKNRNWQIAQGSVIANAGERLEDVHPIVIEGRGHTALSNVEAFSGGNPALSNFGASYDFLNVRGEERLSVSLFGCRMQEYRADDPFTIENDRATVQAVACIDEDRGGRLVNFTREGADDE